MPRGEIFLADEGNSVVMGLVFWVVVDSLLAALLFAVAVLISNHFLGRISEVARLPTRGLQKKALARRR